MSMFGLNYIVLKIKKSESELNKLLAMAISYELGIWDNPKSFDQNQMSLAKHNLIKIIDDSRPRLFDHDEEYEEYEYSALGESALNEFNKVFAPKGILDYGLPRNTPDEALTSRVTESDDAYSIYYPWSSKIPPWNKESNDYNGEYHLDEMENLGSCWEYFIGIYLRTEINEGKLTFIIAGDALSELQPFEKRKLTII